MTWRLELFVPGTPVQQGSKRHVGGGRMIEAAKGLQPWRQLTALAAHNAMLEAGLSVIAPKVEVSVSAVFVFKRLSNAPKREPGRMPMVSPPDIDKLLRAILDALTGVCFADDGQVTHTATRKCRAAIGEMTGVELTIIGKEAP